MSEMLGAAIDVAQTCQSLKDAAKHQALRFLAEIRRALQSLDARLEYDGLIHFLTMEELSQVGLFSASLKSTAEERRRLRNQLLAQKALPASLSITKLEEAIVGVSSDTALNGGGLLGKRVSGDSQSAGQIYQTTRAQSESGEKLSGFTRGDILACSFVHPNWLPYVLKSGGVIAEVGGWLSHIAIVARENNVTLVVGVSEWETLPHGAEVAIELDGQIKLQKQSKIQFTPETVMQKIAVGR